MTETITTGLKQIEPSLVEIANQLYENPELGDQEFQSMELLVDFLKQHGFETETGIAGRPTAFRAEFDSQKPGPVIAYLAEYDALPEVGHGCGHNLIAAMGTGAGVTLSKAVHETGGKVVVIGTPAEETNGAKVDMSAQGVFDNVDVAMMVHAADESYASGSTSAMDALEFVYTGKSSHAAAEPESGINALDSVIQLFNGVNAMREHIDSDIRVHGIITEGGKAANVVPNRAVAQFYVRAPERSALDPVVEQVKNIAQGAALMTGASVDISNFEYSFDNLMTNQVLADTFTNRLKQVSSHPVNPGEASLGSSDMGNVSKVVPAIHPFIGLNEPGLVFHTQEFADKTVTPEGHQALGDGALSLALTGYDVLSDETLFQEIKQTFEQA